MNSIKIKDLYAGKPDAKDEVYFDGLDDFIKTFFVADHFNIDSLISGTNCFITGFKGTGKTALLFFLDARAKEIDAATWSSFVFFKEDFTDAKRDELQAISQRILSCVSVDSDTLLENAEFEYVWRWLLFKRIVSDNEECHRQLFADDEDWRHFEELLARIKDPINKRKSIIPNKLRVAFPYKDPATMTELSPEVEVDLQNVADENYKRFVSLIDSAESAFCKVKKTDVPYYIFIDELEAYYGEVTVFKRDLCLIRDLIFSVKRFNTIFARSSMSNVKIICSVRSEIISAISRFIVTKEINKTISGFSLPLIWNYANTSSYAHPIIQILLKRIALHTGSTNDNFLDVYRKWFPEQIHGIEPASYILNQSWCKPRDIVRLITTAQNSIQNTSTSFSQAVFNSITKAYSEDSLAEIKEELRALYSSDEIDTIISCFTGYKTAFSLQQLRTRIAEYYPGTN